MFYPGTNVEVEDYYFDCWNYVVLYRYKPEAWGEEKYGNFVMNSPKQLIEYVRDVKKCDCIMDYVGAFRFDKENHSVVPVEVRLAK